MYTCIHLCVHKSVHSRVRTPMSPCIQTIIQSYIHTIISLYICKFIDSYTNLLVHVYFHICFRSLIAGIFVMQTRSCPFIFVVHPHTNVADILACTHTHHSIHIGAHIRSHSHSVSRSFSHLAHVQAHACCLCLHRSGVEWRPPLTYLQTPPLVARDERWIS